MQGRQDALIRDENTSIANAWLTEALRRTKRLPRLQTLLHNPDQDPDRPQTPDEVLSVLEAFKAGGADIKLRFIPHGEEGDKEA